MSDDRDRPSGLAGIVLPLATVIILVAHAYWSGVGWGKVSSKLDTIMERLNAVQSQVTALRADSDSMDRRLLAIERDFKAQADQFRLFKMYTKGRIARLPYRATDDGE
jgi:hypothetical protein